MNQKDVGIRIRNAREGKNITQYQLYRMTGISTTQISAYENGKKNIGLQTIAKIAVALGVTVDELYFGSPSKRQIDTAINEGELIVNCVSALFDRNVICSLPHEVEDEYVPMGMSYIYRIGFGDHIDILDDLIEKLSDFERNKDNYPDPISFRAQLLASAAKQINESIERTKKK